MNIKGLYIDRQLFGLLSIFVIVGMILFGALVVATNALSALRAFSTLQMHWTVSQKDVTYELIRYLDTDEIEHLDHFKEDLTLIKHSTRIYEELVSEEPNILEISERLQKVNTHPRDIEEMLTLYKRFHSLEYLSSAVNLWNAANRVIGEMERIEAELRSMSANGPIDEALKSEYINTILELDGTLTEQKNLISVNLSEGTQLVSNIIFAVGIAFGSIFLLSGFYFSFRFRQSIKEWAAMMDISEQRYKSLFEQNPNIVFSLTNKGMLKSGNEAFFKLSNYDDSDIMSKSYKDFPITGYVREFKKQFNAAIKGKADNVELVWQGNLDNKIHLHATMLPIQVNDRTEGVFVIAEDVTFMKIAEEQIKSQLQEKISLLGEVHDRVKNNMALISSFLHLQEGYINDASSAKYIESTIARIQSLAMIHERIYHAENFSSVRMDEFTVDLIAYVKKNHPKVAGKIDVQIHTNRVTLDVRQAIPCGLLLNELVTNAFKFAFVGQSSGTLLVELEEKEHKVTLHVRDDGIGLPSDVSMSDQKSLGMTMVHLLSQQLDGKVEISGRNGLDFRLQFNSKLKVRKTA